MQLNNCFTGLGLKYVYNSNVINLLNPSEPNRRSAAQRYFLYKVKDYSHLLQVTANYQRATPLQVIAKKWKVFLLATV